VAVKVKVGQTKNIRLVAAGEKRPVIVPDSIALGIDTTGEYVRAIDAGQGIVITPENSTESANLVISHSNTSEVANTLNTSLEFLQNATFDTYGHVLGTTSSGLNANNFVIENGLVNTKDFTIGNTSLTLGESTDQLTNLTSLEVGEFTFSANTISVPADLNFNLTSADAVVNIGTHRIINVEDPVNEKDVVNKRYLQTELDSVTTNIKVFDDPVLPTDATNKKYVDNLIKGVVVRPSALAATTEDLGASFALGTGGNADTLTIPAVNVLYIDDVTTWQVGSNVVVKDQTDSTQNGSYDLIQVGDATTAWVFERTTWGNESSELPGSYEFITDGTVNGGTGWVITVDDASSFELNDDTVYWTQFQGEGTYLAGNGLTLNGTQFNVDSTLPLTAITPTGTGDVLTISGDGALTLPSGISASRPTPLQGMVRFNSEDGQFEGYDGAAWAGLGGVIDVDQDTKIVAESSPGADNDQIEVYAGGTLSATFGAARVDFTGDVGIAGNLTIGDQDSDTVAFAADVTSHIIPDQDRIYSLGSASKNWNKIHVDTITSSDEILNIDITGAVKFPSANTALRPIGQAGMLRFNTDEGRFEGYDGSIWTGLAGSVIDLDKNTYIIAETSAGSNNNELDFYTDAIQRMQIGASGDLTFGSNLDKLIINYNTGDMFVNGLLTATNDLTINPVGDINVANNTITGIANPVNPTDAVTLGYLDNTFASGLTIIDQANTYADGVNLLASPTIEIGRGLELEDLDSANNSFKVGLDVTGATPGMYGNDGFIPRIRVLEDGRIDFATDIPVELQANAIPDFTETSRDIISLMFTDGVANSEGITAVNDDNNDKMYLIANNFDVILDGDVSGTATVNRLSDTTITTTIDSDYISNIDAIANNGIIITHTASPAANAEIGVDYTELNTRYITTAGGTSTGNIIAPKFIDIDNQNYFLDPAGTSALKEIEIGTQQTSSQIKLRDGPGSFSYLYAAQGKAGFLDNTFNFSAFAERSTGNWVVQNGDVKAERFVDNDATSYFLHPGGTDSYLKQISVEDKIVVSDISIGGDVGQRTIKVTSGVLDIESDNGVSIDGNGNDLDVNSSKITNVLTPTAPTDAANKAYVDAAAQGLRVIPAALAATTADLGGSFSAGVITSGSNGAFTLDGVTAWTVGDRVLVKDQTNLLENGSYELTVVGDGSTPWELTRGEYFNESSEVPGLFQFITDGTVNKNSGYVATVTDAETFALNTDDVVFYQFSGAGTYTAGESLTLTGTEFSISDGDIINDKLANPQINISGEAGANTVIALGETLTIEGTDGVDTTITSGKIAIAVNEIDGGSF
jgi:hypothetical protein